MQMLNNWTAQKHLQLNCMIKLHSKVCTFTQNIITVEIVAVIHNNFSCIGIIVIIV